MPEDSKNDEFEAQSQSRKSGSNKQPRQQEVKPKEDTFDKFSARSNEFSDHENEEKFS